MKAFWTCPQCCQGFTVLSGSSLPRLCVNCSHDGHPVRRASDTDTQSRSDTLYSRLITTATAVLSLAALFAFGCIVGW